MNAALTTIIFVIKQQTGCEEPSLFRQYFGEVATIGKETSVRLAHFTTRTFAMSGGTSLAVIPFASATTNTTITTAPCVSMEIDMANRAQQQLSALLLLPACSVMCLSLALYSKCADVALASIMIQVRRNVWR
jgi:hypothetical protein